MKKRISFYFIFALSILVFDIIFFVISLIIHNFDLMFVMMIIAALVVLLLLNIRSNSMLKKSKQELNAKEKEKYDLNKKRQKNYWILFFAQVFLITITYLILHFAYNY